MGPHSFKCGKKFFLSPEVFPHSGFNGAALFQVRKALFRRLCFWTASRFNGAALFQVRKVFRGTAGFEFVKELQWGRTLSSAERASAITEGKAASQASMGPHSFKCGKSGLTQAQVDARVASMGPHSFKCGKFLAFELTPRLAFASMGPHSFKCGKK